jgi:RNA polymerase sigma factor (sigma-70 family)
MVNFELIEQKIKEYRKTKNREILNEIVKLLSSIVIEKAMYIYYKRPFYVYIKGDIIKYEIPDVRKLIKKFKDDKEEQKHFIKFKLSQIQSIDYEDVEQSLWVIVIKMIENYKLDKPFKNYFLSTIWNWTPSFINSNLIRELANVSINNSMDLQENEGEDLSYEEILEDKNNNQEEIELFNTLKEKLTNEEFKVCKLLYDGYSLREIAKKLKCSAENVRLIKEKIKNKLDKNSL